MLKSRIYWRSFVALLLASVLIVLTLVPAPTLAQGPDDDNTFTQVYEEISPSVVAISVTARREGTGFLNQDGVVVGGGSGFVIDQEGHILTNNHVVEGATEIIVNFRDGTLVRAEIVGLDPDSDLAVLKVDLPTDQLIPVEFGDSDQLQIGQTVMAIGSPFGQRWTLTSGIVSALDRTIPGADNFSIGGAIQTDAAINPGNSGGPLLDLEGRVIGVNSQIRSSSGSNAGVGFAIPSNLAQRVAQELIENGYVDYSYLGITGGDMTLSLIEAFDLPNNFQGVAVGEVMPGGPADRSGLQEAVVEGDGLDAVPTQLDVITAIDGTPLSGIGALISYLAYNTKPGQTVELTVLRNGEEELSLEARLTPRP